jgi:hypothetical protein
MRAVDSSMPLAAVHHAVPRKSSLAAVRVVPAVVTANAKRARCIALPVQTVGTRPRYLFSRETTGQSIAATVTGRKVLLIEVIIAGRAGNPLE